MSDNNAPSGKVLAWRTRFRPDAAWLVRSTYPELVKAASTVASPPIALETIGWDADATRPSMARFLQDILASAEAHAKRMQLSAAVVCAMTALERGNTEDPMADEVLTEAQVREHLETLRRSWLTLYGYAP